MILLTIFGWAYKPTNIPGGPCGLWDFWILMAPQKRTHLRLHQRRLSGLHLQFPRSALDSHNEEIIK